MNWCPWQSKVLATGGGMKDGILRVWDINREKIIQSAATDSQVKWWNVCMLGLFLYSCAHLANSHWLWGWFCGQRNSRIFSGSASCSIVLHSAPQCMAGLRSSLLFLIHHFCLHTEVLEEEVVSQPDTLYLLFRSDNDGFGQNSHEERTLSGKETSQSAGVGRSLRVRGQTSVSGVCIFGDRRTDCRLE